PRRVHKARCGLLVRFASATAGAGTAAFRRVGRGPRNVPRADRASTHLLSASRFVSGATDPRRVNAASGRRLRAIISTVIEASMRSPPLYVFRAAASWQVVHFY